MTWKRGEQAWENLSESSHGTSHSQALSDNERVCVSFCAWLRVSVCGYNVCRIFRPILDLNWTKTRNGTCRFGQKIKLLPKMESRFFLLVEIHHHHPYLSCRISGLGPVGEHQKKNDQLESPRREDLPFSTCLDCYVTCWVIFLTLGPARWPER